MTELQEIRLSLCLIIVTIFMMLGGFFGSMVFEVIPHMVGFSVMFAAPFLMLICFALMILWRTYK